MKKIFFTVVSVFILLTFASCSLQEKMSPSVFIGRFNEYYPEITVSDNAVYRDGNTSFCFLKDNENVTYAMKIYTDSGENIKKICLVCNNTGKTDNIKYVAGAVMKTYAPQEDADTVTEVLFSEERNYHNTQWYRYSSSLIEGTAYFSVENMKISTASDAELTLKENDTYFP